MLRIALSESMSGEENILLISTLIIHCGKCFPVIFYQQKENFIGKSSKAEVKNEFGKAAGEAYQGETRKNY